MVKFWSQIYKQWNPTNKIMFWLAICAIIVAFIFFLLPYMIKPSVKVIEAKANLKLEVMPNWEVFTISNPTGSTLYVKNISLEVINFNPIKYYIFHDVCRGGGKDAMIPRFDYMIDINKKDKNYLIDKGPFSYKKGDMDQFIVTLNPKDKGVYKFRYIVYWKDMDDDNYLKFESDIIEGDFKETVRYDKLVSELKEKRNLKAHVICSYHNQSYLDDLLFGDFFISADNRALLFNNSVVITDNKPIFELETLEKLNAVEIYVNRFDNESSQFIIFNDELVLLDNPDSSAILITDECEVEYYIDYFKNLLTE